MPESVPGTLDVHLEPDPEGFGTRIVLLLQLDEGDLVYRIALSPERARQMARTLNDLADRQARVARAGEN